MKLLRIVPLLALFAGLTPPAHAAALPTRATYSYADAIRETVYVESALDGDGDGRKDRITTDIIRPRANRKIPVIMQTSPYYAPFRPSAENQSLLPQEFDPGIKDLADDGHPDRFPSYYDNYFVPRGYAFVQADLAGTRFSEGCLDMGPAEIAGAKAVIDWLGGRARAFDRDGRPVAAGWTSGKVGLHGISWGGTVPNGVATTDVPNLKTIVPISAISTWYDYLRDNGGTRFSDHPTRLTGWLTSDQQNLKCAEEYAAMRAGAPESGDYSSFFAERDVVRDAHRVRASVFAIHGLQDQNVSPHQTTRWWKALGRAGVPRKMWLSQSGHVDPRRFRMDAYLTTLHRWFDHWLYGIDTGIMREPAVDIERAPGVWEQHRSWPAPDARPVKLKLDELSSGPRQVFTDDPAQTEDEMASRDSTHRLAYLSEPLAQDARLSGRPSITLRASANVPNTPLTALLVDYGTDTRVDPAGEGTRQVEGAHVCIGETAGLDINCYQQYELNVQTKPFQIVSRGFQDAAHRFTLHRSVPLRPGAAATFRWELQPQDYVFKAGHRIGIVLAANDSGSPYRDPRPSGEITVSPQGSSITLPIVDGLKF